jgi:transposase
MKKLSDSIITQIICLIKAKLALRQIADIINVSYSSVQQIRRSLNSDFQALEPGRPHKLSNRNISFMMHLIHSNKATSSIDLKRSLKCMNISISPWTIRRTLKENGLSAITVKPKPYLSLRHKRLRRQFALMHKDWTISDWKCIIFSDETKINRFGNDGPQYIWKRPSSSM